MGWLHANVRLPNGGNYLSPISVHLPASLFKVGYLQGVVACYRPILKQGQLSVINFSAFTIVSFIRGYQGVVAY